MVLKGLAVGETAPLRFLLSRFHQVGSTKDSFSGHWADEDWVAKYSTKVHIQRRQAEFLKDFSENILKVKYMTRHFTEIQLFILFFYNSTLLWNSDQNPPGFSQGQEKTGGLSSALDSFQASSPASSPLLWTRRSHSLTCLFWHHFL